MNNIITIFVIYCITNKLLVTISYIQIKINIIDIFK